MKLIRRSLTIRTAPQKNAITGIDSIGVLVCAEL
jgi:hypothetical protein